MHYDAFKCLTSAGHHPLISHQKNERYMGLKLGTVGEMHAHVEIVVELRKICFQKQNLFCLHTIINKYNL